MVKFNLSDKWKKIISIIVFFVLTYGILLGIGIALTPKNPLDRASYRTTDIRGVTVEEANTLDVVNIGHSGVMYGINPMEMYEKYGIASYNLAETSQSPREAYDILAEVLKTQSPKVVVLNVDQFFYDKAENKLRFAFQATLSKAFPIFGSHTNWRRLIGKENNERSICKNYIVSTDVIPCDGNKRMGETDEVYKIRKGNLKNLERIVKLCEDKGIELVLVEIPSTIYWSYSRHNAIVEFAKKHKDLPFVDLNVIDIGIDWSKDTRDKGDHMNFSGSTKVSDYIGQYLVDNYAVGNHRGEEAYAEWENDLVKFRAKYGYPSGGENE